MFQFVPGNFNIETERFSLFQNFYIKTKRCGQFLKLKKAKTDESCLKCQNEKRFHTV